MSRLLSIVVPIKESYEYVKFIIKKIELIDSDDIELIIQDNSEHNKEMVDFLSNSGCKAAKYYYRSEALTMTENFELGIANSSGEYLCILGADDNVSSKIVNVAKYLGKNDIESAIFRKASYNWPGVKFRVHKNLPNLAIHKVTGKIMKIDVEKELEHVMKIGAVSLARLPEPYHGIVRKDTLDRVRERTGRYIPGACPDMAMAVALSQVVKNHILIDAPITISGHSYNSAGGKGARGEHKGSLKDKPFLPKNIEETWPSVIPKIWTGPTIYADSLSSALKAFGKQKDFAKLNIEANYATISLFFPEYRNLVKEYMKTQDINMTRFYFEYLRKFAKRASVFVKNWAVSQLGISLDKVFYNIENSLEASKIVDDYIMSRLADAPYIH